MRWRIWAAVCCVAVHVAVCAVDGVGRGAARSRDDSDVIRIGFTSEFHLWKSPHKPWAGPQVLPGVCSHRCVWEKDPARVQFVVHPAHSLAPTDPPQAGLPEGARLLLYCMEPGCMLWANASHPQVAAVVGWHPGFSYWLPMECPAVVSLAYQNRAAHLPAVRRVLDDGYGLPAGQRGARVPSDRRAPVVSVHTNCLEWRRSFVEHLGMHIPVDNHGSCLRNVASNESALLLTTSQEAVGAASDAAGYAFTLQGNKLQTIRDYTFAIAYENSFTQHYVTEKVYDALLTGVIPVYFGAANIRDYVNPDCIVAADRFGSAVPGNLSMNSERLAAELRHLLSTPGRVDAMQSCQRPVSPAAPHAQRCVDVLRSANVSPFADGHGGIRLPGAMLSLAPQTESTLVFCSLCDAAAAARQRQQQP